MRFPLLLAFLQFLLLLFDRISSRCLDDQRSSLLQLKNSLSYNHNASLKLVSWNPTIDCCSWKGVTCDQAQSRVFGLNLSSESITGGITSSSALFDLRYLQRLSFANNNLYSSQIPSGFDRLLNLTYLDLSNSGFSGQIPIEISRLTSLVYLNLSTLFPGVLPLRLQNPDLTTLVRNLSRLKELRLDGVNISAQGSEWSQALSSALPDLQVLSLSNCELSGPPHVSLLKLRSLSQVHLDQNSISQVPEFFANFSSLTTLHLTSCGLTGKFPEGIFQLSTLQNLDLSLNPDLQGSLPECAHTGSLRTLVLTDTSFSGKLPESIGNLKLLSRLDISRCKFSGSIPSNMSNLAQLNYLDFSLNSFSGQIPSFELSKNLTSINLAHNRFTGPIPFSRGDSLQNLVNLELQNNSLNGTIPPSLFALPSLQRLTLSDNQLSGRLAEFSNPSSSLLDSLDLSSNKLAGPIPESVFELKLLKILKLSSNKLNGTLPLDMIQDLRNLSTLDLSYNELSIDANNSNSTFSSSHRITTFKLASCNLSIFPAILKDQSELSHLDLSNNQIHGLIPNWIWKSNVIRLNLSYNYLVSLELPLPDLSFSQVAILDLHNNLLQGLITPLLPPSASVLDLSINNFTSEIPANISSYLSITIFLSLSGNKFVGEIPTSICGASTLKVLDLSNNSLSGQIPQCVGRMGNNLAVLSLTRNKFNGTIPNTFSSGCTLETLDLNQNMLGGQLPRSLVECKMLEVLNIGNNQIYDTFPLWLGNLSYLLVLVMRFNRFHGTIGFAGINNKFPMLKIIDLSSNNFNGSPKCFLSWKGMMIDEDEAWSKFKPGILKYDFLKLSPGSYQNSVIVTIKGQEMALVKILTVFSSLDLSSNRFSGEIPKVIGNLTSLHVLNLSHNSLTGEIPSSLGNLKQLESLDLSRNKLNGKIPMELVNLTFLSFLNISWNQLVGMIPQASQFLTFTNVSYIGNIGLCGLPLAKKCEKDASPPPPPTSMSENSNSKSPINFDWQFISTGLGFGGGAGLVFGSLIFWKKGRKWYDEHIDRAISVILTYTGLFSFNCDRRVEAEEAMEVELTEISGDYDDNEEEEDEDERYRGKFCVFCSKLDFSRERPVHDPNCACHISESILASP